MSMGMIGAAVIGGGLSYMGASKQADAATEAAEASRDLPDWLRPYLIGDPGPAPQPVPTNYNWLDEMNTIASTGMPGQPPPMSMNNPMMTFQDVYTPMAGGPWGMGMGPGQLTSEAGIPGAPGAQFLQPGQDFQPGVTGPVPGEDPAGAQAEEMMDWPTFLQNANRYGSRAQPRDMMDLMGSFSGYQRQQQSGLDPTIWNAIQGR